METKQLPDDLNLKTAQRLCFALVAVACASLAFAVVQPKLLGMSAVALLSVAVINRKLYTFFFRQRGFCFTAGCIPLHLLYYLYSGISYLYVSAECRLRRVAPVQIVSTLKTMVRSLKTRNS